MTAHQNFKSLRLDGVGRAFGSVNALKDMSFEIERGEFIALLGPSGCGKTTALNCIAGLLATTSGAIWLDDRRIDTLAVEDRGFGMVFQNYALFPHMTVRNNIGFGLKMRGMAKDKIAAKVDEALRVVRLEAHGHKLPGQLSGGQQQRVAIARAIAIDPPLVLMDEPLSNLDAKLRLEMRQEIRRLHLGLGGVTIYVTHDQDEALSMADRIVVMRDGVIRQIGTPEALYSRPAQVDVAEFMGFRNRLTGRALTASAAGTPASIALGDSNMTGIAVEPLRIGSAAVLAIRPDDLTPASSGIKAQIEAIEYRGRDFYGQARTSDGEALFFRSETRLSPGDVVQLAADPARALLYPEAA